MAKSISHLIEDNEYTHDLVYDLEREELQQILEAVNLNIISSSKIFLLSVNGHQCSLPILKILSNSGILPWRNNDPIDITQQTHLRKKCLQNTLEITWSEEPHKYIGCVYMAQKLTFKDLLVELKKRPKRASDKTKVLIKESVENDGDMLVEFLIASIKDPLSKIRMKLPARGVDCKHLLCFDAIQFLQMNELKQTWKCPIFQSKDLTEECDNVFLFKDGTWSERKNREFSKNAITNASRSTKNIEKFTMSDSDDADNSNRILDNVDNDEIIPKQKRIKCNPSKV
ncbi:E3 SUMO-protein ligase PIAS3-like [Acyrthosiphon pisum]|uniref:SP-RING-type domain-containing protein n=1 Tax=Acyrthosiphon pisum TaxID=7029 RepID=A0A8R2B1Y6_ACYPI|nr:E3 SUMO-protein ligase PIAS3-like [Acyrthosiphon pisum]|eukprot:XP_008180027.1 PREDICTED: E3 SUMO-protein ligase PIAS3-like [Acyrthosiphon pisum]